MFPLTRIHTTKSSLTFFANTSSALFARAPFFPKPKPLHRVHATGSKSLLIKLDAERQSQSPMTDWAKGFDKKIKDLESGKQNTYRPITKEEGKHLDRLLREDKKQRDLGYRY